MNCSEKQTGSLRPGFTPAGMWAFSIGTSIGWGSFIVTCNAYLQKSGILCKTFKHSPVFRVGGDEFAVISRGDDLDHIDDLLGIIAKHNQEAFCTGDIVIACGMAKYESGKDSCVASVFERADQAMYENKNDLKSSEA